MDFDTINRAGFNTSEAIEKIGSEEIYKKILSVFIYETGAALVLIEGARVLKDYRECCRLIHTIRGGAATLGHEGITELSGKTEDVIGELIEDEEITHVNALNASLDELIEKKLEEYVSYCSAVLRMAY